MNRLSWLSPRAKPSSSTTSLSALAEAHQLEDAMRGANHIMNDDLAAAEEALRADPSSPFHKLGLSAAAFLRATLSFEQALMKDATARLGDAEAAAAEAQRRSLREEGAFRSAIYPPASEYALCQAQAQLMGAVVGVLNESLTEALRGFYKLRKAYAALQTILDAEARYVEVNGAGRKSNGGEEATRGVGEESDSEEEEEFFDAGDAADGTQTTTEYLGRLSTDDRPSASSTPKPRQSMTADDASSGGSYLKVPVPPEDDLDPDIFTNTIDEYIHSGACLCSGMLLLLLSLVPPVFNRLLSILGFRGDRDRGLTLLWRATRFNDLSGGIAGLVILGYYNNTVSFCDILSTSAYPRARCEALLAEMRERYPGGRLWILEDARGRSSQGRLEEAVDMLVGDAAAPSPLKQVLAIQWFEASMDMMFLHRYADAAASFVKVVGLNNWSHGLYYYIAAACHVELYRACKARLAAGGDANTAEESGAHGEAEQLNQHEVEVRTLLEKAHAACTNKKRLFARRLPFDAFIERKVLKWMAKAKASGCEIVEAVGVAPVEEMIYFWGGYSRMRPEMLRESLERLKYGASNAYIGNHETASDSMKGAGQEELDERGARAVLQACVHRRLGDTAAAKSILQREVLGHEWAEFKGPYRDTWCAPVARYEMAVCCWTESDASGKGIDQDRDVESLKDCARWLDKVAKWESFDLEARVGLRVTTARTTLKKLGVDLS